MQNRVADRGVGARQPRQFIGGHQAVGRTPGVHDAGARQPRLPQPVEHGCGPGGRARDPVGDRDDPGGERTGRVHAADESGDVVVRRRRYDLRRGSDLHQAAVAQDRNPVAESECLIEVVRDEYDRFAQACL